MGRLIVNLIAMIIMMVLSIMAPRRRGSFYRRSMYGRNYYGDDHTMDYIRMFIRRRRALSKAKAFVKRKRHNITLKNSNVMLIFDTKFKTFVLIDIKNTKRTATIIWAEQPMKMSDVIDYSADVDTEMEKTFDSICRSFNAISNYLGILRVLKQKFTIIKENTPPQEIKKIQPKDTKQQVVNTQKDKVNINSLDEAKLAKLPGISVILAKKIMNRINLKGDFKSIDEFYKEMKIKSHFQKKLDEIIYVKPVERKNNTGNDDRIIDL